MSGLVRIFLALLIASTLVGVVQAQGFQARPEFEGYETPVTQFPAPRSIVLESVDVVALFVALCLASYLAIRKRSRRGLFVLAAVSLGWFGFYREGCVCSIGSIQNVALALFEPSYTVPLTVVAFFTLPLLFTLFFGRTFCASVCPLGAMQELTLFKPIRVPVWLEHALGVIPFIYLGGALVFAATNSAFLICQYDPYVGFFRLSGNANMIVFGGSILLIGLFVGRPYCRFLCPAGALFGLLSRITRWHVRITPVECVNCRLCEDACPYGAIREPTVDQSSTERRRGRRRLLIMLLLLPLLIVIGVWFGRSFATPFSRIHPDVRLAERLRMEETGQRKDTKDASEAFRKSGRPSTELYAEVLVIRERFAVACRLFGGWIGLVVGVKLIRLCLRRRRKEYTTDRALCVSCARCFRFCPEDSSKPPINADKMRI